MDQGYKLKLGHCQIRDNLVPDIDECIGIDCLNGGTCLDRVGFYQCDCAENYVGDHCGTCKLFGHILLKKVFMFYMTILLSSCDINMHVT